MQQPTLHHTMGKRAATEWTRRALFAVAFTEALWAGKDPHALTFDQSQMRYLFSSAWSVVPFHTSLSLPSKEGKDVHEWSCPERSTYTADVVSHGINKKKMVQCIICKEWFHQSCLQIPDTIFLDPSSVWTCNDCDQVWRKWISRPQLLVIIT